jgi:hypothetical protein
MTLPVPSQPRKDIFQIVTALLVLASALCRSEEPSLTVYEIVREDLNIGRIGQVILKINNPTTTTYYIPGSFMTDVPCVIEIERDGKWVTWPQRRTLLIPKMRPFLPSSYLLFDTFTPFVQEPRVTFRVRAFLYTNPTFTNPYMDLTKRPFIEVVSRSLSTKELEPLEEPVPPEPSIPGLRPIPAQ